MLRLCEPHVAWGYPNLKSIRALLYKRGCGKIKHRRIPLTSNSLIEKTLKKYNVICMEDIVNQLYTVGPAFSKVSNFLWPFKVSLLICFINHI